MLFKSLSFFVFCYKLAQFRLQRAPFWDDFMVATEAVGSCLVTVTVGLRRQVKYLKFAQPDLYM